MSTFYSLKEDLAYISSALLLLKAYGVEFSVDEIAELMQLNAEIGRKLASLKVERIKKGG